MQKLAAKSQHIKRQGHALAVHTAYICSWIPIAIYDRICKNPVQNTARSEIQMMACRKATFVLSRHTNVKATNKQVRFHWHHFCDPASLRQSTMECTVPLGKTNKAMLIVKLLPATVSA